MTTTRNQIIRNQAKAQAEGEAKAKIVVNLPPHPTFALESDSAIGPVPLPAPTTATPSADSQEEEHTSEGLSPTMTTTTSTTVDAAAAATAEITFSVTLLSYEDLMRAKEGMLRDVEAGTSSLIQYLAPQLELELDPGLATRGWSAERTRGWDGGGLNDDKGGHGFDVTLMIVLTLQGDDNYDSDCAVENRSAEKGGVVAAGPDPTALPGL